MVDFKRAVNKIKIKKGKLPAIALETQNDDGVFTSDTSKKLKKDGTSHMIVNYEGCRLINTVTGEIITEELAPKFEDWTYDMYVEQFKEDQSIRHIDPMGALEPANYEQGPEDIAELKRDGHRALCYITKEGNRFFSRRPSKKTGWYSENTDTVPHLRDLDLSMFQGTVLDGELDYGKDSRSVQSVTGAKPENAINYQFHNGFIPFVVFDILYYNGVNVQAMPLWKRKIYAAQVCRFINNVTNFPLVQFSEIYAHPSARDDLSQRWRHYIDKHDMDHGLLMYLEANLFIEPDYISFFRKLVAEDKEGLIIKNMEARYEQKKTKSMLKLKGESTWDVIFMGLSEPEMEYDGKLLEEGRIHEWSYWYHPEKNIRKETTHASLEIAENWMSRGWIPVTKPFFKNWCGGIVCGVYRDIEDPEYGFDWDAEYGDAHEPQAWKDGLLIDTGEKIYNLYEVTTVKGLTEEVMIDLEENADKYAREKRVLAITANGMQDKSKGSLRHPRFFMWRDDKTADMCLFEDHIAIKGEE
ncbi:ATP-dependent DNA ligase [compost metagenome]